MELAIMTAIVIGAALIAQRGRSWRIAVVVGGAALILIGAVLILSDDEPRADPVPDGGVGSD